jgi:phosphatidate cytidylyltransferase
MVRLASGVALAAAALAAILFLPVFALRVLAAVVAALTAREYLGIVHPATTMAATGPWLLLVAATCWWMLLPGPYDVLWLVLAGVAWVAIEVLVRGLTVDQAGTRFLAPWYIGMPLGLLTAVHAQHGAAVTLLLIATVIVSDSAQYYSGRAFGRRPLAPMISPKKTIEGAIGGVVAGTLFMTIAGSRLLPDAAPVPLLAAAVAVVVLGICGDLFESRLKRVAGVKDSSSLIPGHGGILDRIDALLFATPAYFLFLRTVA